MKCPKCSYTSFDYLDSCKRCGNDLQEVRTLLQIIAVSPDDRAALVGGAGALTSDGPSPQAFVPSTPVTVPEDFDEGEELDFGADRREDDLLSDVSFDDSFDSMMEPTGLAPAELAGEAEVAAAPAATAGRPEDEGEGLVLDLDGLDDFVETSLREAVATDEDTLDLDGLIEPTGVGGTALPEEEPLALDALVEPTSLGQAVLPEAGALELDALVEPTSLAEEALPEEEPLSLEALAEATNVGEAADGDLTVELDGLVEPTSLAGSLEAEEEPLKLDELIEPTSLRAGDGADAEELDFEEDGMADLLDLDFADVFGDAKEERE